MQLWHKIAWHSSSLRFRKRKPKNLKATKMRKFKKKTNCKQSTNTKNTSDDAKIKLTSQTPINKSAKIYHVSDQIIGFWPCLIKMLTSSAPSTLVSSSSINASIQRPLRSQPRMALFNTTTSAVTPRRSREGEKHLKTWDWMHLTQFPSAVEQFLQIAFSCFEWVLSWVNSKLQRPLIWI